jgi:hypothetical protein
LNIDRRGRFAWQTSHKSSPCFCTSTLGA